LVIPNGQAEYAQKVPAADLSDLIRGKSSLQHRIHYDVVEPDRLIRPCFIGAFADSRMLLTGVNAVRARTS
jgi:hypothetical protein